MTIKRVLIVDDEPDFTHTVRGYLERAGNYVVKEENRGVQALYSAQEFRPDLVLLDIMMQDIDGSDVAEQLRADDLLCRVPIVFLTGVITKEEAGEHGGVIGGHPFLAKPVGLKEVLEFVQKQIGPSTP